MTSWRPILEKNKFKQVILYLLNSSANNPLLGKVKLFKLLYYVDFDHYQTFKPPVTGDTYRKLPYGPVPDQATNVLSEMVTEELVQISTRLVGNYTQYVFTPLEKNPDIKKLAASEIEVLDKVIDRWVHSTTNEIVAATHGEAPWRAAEMGSEIPYALALYRREIQTEDIPNNYEDLEELAIAS